MRTAQEMVQFCATNHFGTGNLKSWDIKHFTLIENDLQPDEEILFAFEGFHNYESISKHNNTFAYAVTNQRFMLAQNRLNGGVLQSIILSQVKDITFTPDRTASVITIETTREQFNIALMNKNAAENVYKRLHDLLLDKNDPVTTTTVRNPVSVAQLNMSIPTPQQDKPPSKALKIIAICFIVAGIGLAVTNVIAALIITLIGCGLLHHQFTKIEISKAQPAKRAYRRPWVIVTVLAFLYAAGSTELLPPAVEDIRASTPAPTELAIPDTKEITYTYSPSDADISNLSCTVSDSALASVEITSAEDGKVTCLVTPLAVGDVSIVCTSDNITSPTYDMTIRDPAAEEAARKAAEEAERKAAEEAARKAAEEAERKAAEEAARKAAEEAERKAAEQTAATQSQQESPQQSSGRTVYITPSGKRWHLDPDCGGKNSFPVSQDNVGNRTACQKCAGG